MKSKFIFCALMGLLLTGCSTKQLTPKPVENAYETSASKYVEWYEATPEEFLLDWNANLPEDVKPFEVLDSSDLSTQLSNNGETWIICIQTHKTDITEEANGKIVHIKLDLSSDSEEDDIENGIFIRTFFNTLNPGQAEMIEDKMKIYEPDEQPKDLYQCSYGNTRYIYAPGESHWLQAYPIAVYEPEDSHSPVKPE